MAVTNSTALKLYVDDVVVACGTDATLTMTHSLREVLCKNTDSWREVVPGMRSWSVSGAGLMDVNATNGAFDLAQLAIDRTAVDIKFSTEETGDNFFEGTGYLTEVTANSPGAEENCTYSFSFEGSGPLTIDQVA